jgi:hypothetical protein
VFGRHTHCDIHSDTIFDTLLTSIRATRFTEEMTAMTDADLVDRGKKLYEQILSISFSHDEMLAFGQAVFGKTPWGALMPTAKIAMFRLAAGIVPPTTAAGTLPIGAALPVTELAGDTAEEAASEDTSDDVELPVEPSDTDQ